MELFLSVLSRTYIKLKTTFDRRFVMAPHDSTESSNSERELIMVYPCLFAVELHFALTALCALLARTV
jgi:hypothetical protein